MTSLEWLETGYKNNKKVKDVLAAYIYRNEGEPLPTKWGDTRPGGAFEYMGLTIEDALDLISLWHFLQGMLKAEDGRNSSVAYRTIQDVIKAQEEIYKKEIGA